MVIFSYQFQQGGLDEGATAPRISGDQREDLDPSLARRALGGPRCPCHFDLFLVLERLVAVLAANGLGSIFPHVYAPENAGVRKPDPAGLVKLLSDIDVTRDRALFIGDSVNDFAAGHDAGVATIGVRCGYYTGGEPGPDLWVDDWRELVELWSSARNGS